ncbi:DsbA family protein [Candidatus Woesearchaeota archaeon]|nr:DsbA family protein [Candidatus Woesearchaeota archaeon]
MKTSKKQGYHEQESSGGAYDESRHNPEHEQRHEHKHKSHAEQKAHKKQEKLRSSSQKIPGATYPIVSGIIIVILLTLVIILLLRKPFSDTTGGDTTPTYTGEKAKVEFYVMSQCPYGTQVVDAIGPVLENLGEAVDFHLDYIVTETSPGTFQSLHGAKEVAGNTAQLCAIKYYPDNYEYMKLILCQNKDYANVDTNWESCAKENNMDVEKLRACITGEEGKTLLRESMQKAQLRNARGSPTIYFDDQAYGGARDSLSFQRAICNSIEHEACEEMPKCATDADCKEQPGKEGTCNNPGTPESSCTYTDPVAVELIILTSEDCTGSACDTTRIVQVFQQLFLGIKQRTVDISSEEGKALIEKHNLEVVPVYITDSNVVKTKTWIAQPDLKSAFEQLSDGSYRLLDEVTGATYFVSEEARQEFYDVLGIKLGDNKPQIDFFVMSYCPYGNQMEEAVEPAYQLLKDKAIFNPRYVIYSNYGGGGPDYCISNGNLCSMHGIQELNQNVREACVNKYMGIDKWFEFALAMNDECNYQNADTCWEAVAKKLGLDTDKIKKCQEEEAVELMTVDKALGDKLGVSGSPTTFIDGESYGGGRTGEAIKQALCAAFETQPSECSTTLDGSATAVASGSC